jgi:membrane-bound lytic murein transglycosylase D
VTEHLADNGQLLLAPELVLRKITVKAHHGDTLMRLASRHGVSATSVADLNRLKPNATLSNGQILSIYVPAKASRKSAPQRSQARAKTAARSDKRSDRPAAQAAPKR